jgi:hypothetical protein
MVIKMAISTETVNINGFSSTARKSLIVDTAGNPITTLNPLPTTATISGDVNVDSTSISVNAYVGKPVGGNGDFVTTYTSATQITLSALPTGITNINQQDIELIRQINTSGTVVNSYSRDDATITIAANVITVAGATFGATNTFVVYTNLAKPVAITGDVNVDATSINTNAYIGKPSGTNGDFVTARTGLTTFTCATLPSGISSLKASDIELIRSTNTVGTVTHSYSRDDVRITCSGTDPTTVTVTGADFAATDTIVVYTNISKIGSTIVTKQTSSKLLSAGALAFTTAFAHITRIQSVLLKFTGATNQTVTITLDNGTGANYDTLLFNYPLINATDFFWEPDDELIISATDEIVVTCTNTGVPAITCYCTVLGEER